MSEEKGSMKLPRFDGTLGASLVIRPWRLNLFWMQLLG